jgi:hypothetical protein
MLNKSAVIPAEAGIPSAQQQSFCVEEKTRMNTVTHRRRRAVVIRTEAVVPAKAGTPRAQRQPTKAVVPAKAGTPWLPKHFTGALLTLALLIATLCAPSPPCAAEAAVALTPEQHALAALLPGDGAIPGWKKPAPPEFYGPENLWDCINGAAALYLDYGFRALVAQYYTTEDRKGTAQVEIYQMESPLNAFAIYAAERSPEDNAIQVGVQGYLGENALNFWKGPYYVKVTSYKTGDNGKGILRNLAGIVAERIPGQFTMPAAFRYFPTENRVPASERYIPKNFLGQPFFKGGYRVDYHGEPGNYQLFLVPNASAEGAKQAFAKYLTHLESRAGQVALEKKGDYQMMTSAGREAVFQYKSFVGGVLGTSGAPPVRELAQELIAGLKEQSSPRQ